MARSKARRKASSPKRPITCRSAVQIRFSQNKDHVAIEQGVDGSDGPGQTVVAHLGHFLGLFPGQAGIGGDDPQSGVRVGIWLVDNPLLPNLGGGVGELMTVGRGRVPRR